MNGKHLDEQTANREMTLRELVNDARTRIARLEEERTRLDQRVCELEREVEKKDLPF